MPYFDSAEDVYRYVGGAFRQAADHPEAGPKLAAANISLAIHYSDPESHMLVRFHEPKLEVVDGANEPADVELELSADIADRFWRGDYNLAVGLAKREVKAKGSVTTLLKLVPLAKPVFPIYRELVAQKDGAAA